MATIRFSPPRSPGKKPEITQPQKKLGKQNNSFPKDINLRLPGLTAKLILYRIKKNPAILIETKGNKPFTPRQFSGHQPREFPEYQEN